MDHTEEGFVVRFANGERVKFKSLEYLKIARIISGCTPLEIWRHMKDNGDSNPEYYESLPEEFREEVDNTRIKLSTNFSKILKEALVEFIYAAKSIGYDPEMHEVDDYRKPLGLLLKSEEFKHAGVMFPMLTNNYAAIDKYIYKTIKPVGNVL